ncbi:MAG TPA: ABC transporter substrate-binding protein, partial [Lachnospiraceae bacterium]|nr:ABC transporter substrate-binding protein [Lachnospiraceae bacterium]
DPDGQQAIRYAVDYAGIQNVCGEGSVTPKSIIQVGFMGSAGELDTATAQDLDKAKELMEKAGYADGFDIDMPVCELDMEGVPLLDLAQKVKEDLSAININVNIVQQNWSGGYGDDYRAGNIGLTVMYWGIDYNDPNVQLAFLPGEEVGLRAGWTADGHEETLDLYDQILSATDNEVRSDLLEQLQSSIESDCPFIMLAQAACHIGYSSSLDGVAFSDTYRIDVTSVNVK